MTRTLFIGLDGATFTVLDQMTRELQDVGVTMPFLKQFIERGVRAKLKSTSNPVSPVAIASIMTGRSPGHHGIFDFIRAEEKGSDVYFTLYDARDIKTETLWSIASRQGRRVVALNFLLTSPPRHNSGSIVPGFVSWKHLRRNISPPELYMRLKTIPDFNPKDLAWDFELEKQAVEDLSEADVERWVRYHLSREEQWYRIAEFLLQEDQPDLMAVWFDGTDKIQHQAWRFLDPSLLKAQPSEWESRMRELCLCYFRHVDRYIQSLVRLAGPGVQVFIASDHGFTTTTEVLRINTFLHQKGYLKWRASDNSPVGRRRDQSNFANIDWNESLAYCRTPSSNGITIRVAECPGDPGIHPGDYMQFRERIINDLHELKDEQTGEPVVKEIMSREDVFPGPCLRDAPDLTLVLRDHGFVSIRNLEPEVIKRKAPAGTHHRDGIFLAGGMGIERGLVSEPRNIVDVAPTLLYSLGLAVPEDLEGEVPAGFFTKEFVAVNPVVRGAPTLSAEDGEVKAEEITEEERAQIIRQLQACGYLERGP